MGLEGRDVTMWRISTYTRMKPDPPTVYVIPIQILSSPPRVMKDGNKCEIVPGSYTVIKGSFELMPGSDYLLYGSEEDNPQTD
ncbi:hypothetical protein N7523_005527 [Penicillium sp. IBT 18751x]|nr:hypothetical protein N7523_005527 [Penicillium sp. IBT 18751x]